MNRFQTIRRPDDPDLEPIYEEIVDHGFGEERPVNWFVSQSMRRDILATTWALGKGLILQGVLPATVKQLIVVAVYTSNNCRYCRVTHSKALEALGVPHGVVEGITSNLDLTKLVPQQRAIVEFALRTSSSPKSITDEEFGVLHDFGLNDGEIMEAAMIAAVTNFINTWSEVSGIEVDGEEMS